MADEDVYDSRKNRTDCWFLEARYTCLSFLRPSRKIRVEFSWSRDDDASGPLAGSDRRLTFTGFYDRIW